MREMDLVESTRGSIKSAAVKKSRGVTSSGLAAGIRMESLFKIS